MKSLLGLMRESICTRKVLLHTAVTVIKKRTKGLSQMVHFSTKYLMFRVHKCAKYVKMQSTLKTVQKDLAEVV